MNKLREKLQERHRTEVMKSLAVEFQCVFVPETELPPRLAALLVQLSEANTRETVPE